MNLSGMIPPMITPLKNGGDVDEGAVQRLVSFLIEHGVAGIFIMGSSGEGPWLDSRQRKQIIRYTVSAVAGRVPVLVGALEPGTGRTLEMAQLIRDCGADIVVVAAPYYFGADAATQLQHINRVVEQAPLPVVLYNIPPMTHNPISAATVAQMLHLPNLLGIKDSAGEWNNFAALLQLRAQRPDFSIFQGAEKQAAQSMIAEADGLVAGLANLVPQKFVSIIELARQDQPNAAQDVQHEINQLWELHTHGFWLACLKYAASLMGFGDGSLSSPAQPLSETAKDAIAEHVNGVIG